MCPAIAELRYLIVSGARAAVLHSQAITRKLLRYPTENINKGLLLRSFVAAG